MEFLPLAPLIVSVVVQGLAFPVLIVPHAVQSRYAVTLTLDNANIASPVINNHITLEPLLQTPSFRHSRCPHPPLLVMASRPIGNNPWPAQTPVPARNTRPKRSLKRRRLLGDDPSASTSKSARRQVVPDEAEIGAQKPFIPT